MLVNSPTDFDYLEIGLASPDRIRFWSHGEVEKPETINYRTFKPERKGLFCEKIFGPVKDWECSCGKYRRVRYRGIVCERCGVEVTHSKVRRERMGHIELAADVSHIWFLKGIPSYMGLLLDMSSRQLEEVIYYDSYIVTSVDDAISSEIQVKQVLSTTEFSELKDKYGEKFQASMGASAIKDLLAQIDLDAMLKELLTALDETKGQKRLKITKRLRIIEALAKSGNRPEWMVLEVIPVMPPDLRPMVQLEGGRFATSDLNDLYRRVVNRNNRLKRLMDIGAPEMIIRNEKRMLQESVDVLISNGKRGRSVTGSNGRPLKSLGNIIEGKQGRFRQNLLGKRVDYSGRSVIVVGPHLKFHQCGLPKEMALELFKPFVIRKLVENGLVTNVKSAKRKIERREVVVWDVLEEVIQGQPVLLNRAPTLHRLGIQAFEPVLVEGSAIQVHPLVCTAFNADFDGDQMAVHVPLSLEAQAECRLLIMSSNNILSPANGKSIVTPTQDMVLGIYYITVIDEDDHRYEKKYFSDIAEAWRAWDARAISLQALINVRIDGKRIYTSMGRVIFNCAIWDSLDESGVARIPFINETVGKKNLADFVYDWFIEFGNETTARLVDKLKSIGFKYSTLSGISISIDDMIVPKSKDGILENAEKEIVKLEKLLDNGSITGDDKILRSNEIWRGVTSEISDRMEREFGRLNNVFIMANSGARGNIDQVRQLAGMRGLMSDSQGRTVAIPIKSNFKEGLTITEYFISSYGARKGLVDTALRTADSGYLTRRLVDVAQDMMVTQEDCGVKEGTTLAPIWDGNEIAVSIGEQIEGRFTLKDVVDPDGKVIVKKDTLLSAQQAKDVEKSGVTHVEVRHIYRCQSERGVCQKCYGIDLSSGRLINIGEAIGIIAAQSIGEPGTQLTMRTFHTGGVDLRKASRIEIRPEFDATVKLSEDLAYRPITDDEGAKAWISITPGTIQFVSAKKTTDVREVAKGSIFHAKDGDSVKADTVVSSFDPTFEYVLSETEGTVKFFGLKVASRKDKAGKLIDSSTQSEGEIVVFRHNDEKEYVVSDAIASKLKVGDRVKAGFEIVAGTIITHGGIVSKISDGEEKSKKKKLRIALAEAYPVLEGARIYVKEGDKIVPGDVLVRERFGDSDVSKTKDIVQGLPRVEELFEARRPKDASVISEISGFAEISDKDGMRHVKIYSEDGSDNRDYKVPSGIRLLVYSGKKVERGDQITEGVPSPHDILESKGVLETQRYLSEEVQRVYRSQGVRINGKHVEVIVRQMTRKVNIVDMGDSILLPNELVDMRRFASTNDALVKQGKAPATGTRVLLGITRSSLNTESFISASSFQETARVLSEAAIKGKRDPMYGLKENVIIGKLIPAGTGLSAYSLVSLEADDDELTAEVDSAVLTA